MLEVEGTTEVLCELETETVWEPDVTLEVDSTVEAVGELEPEEIMEVADESMVDEVEESKDEELELDAALVVGLETDVMMVDCELEDWVLDRLLDCTLESADDFELETVLVGVLESEALTVECVLDDCVLKLLDEAVEW